MGAGLPAQPLTIQTSAWEYRRRRAPTCRQPHWGRYPTDGDRVLRGGRGNQARGHRRRAAGSGAYRFRPVSCREESVGYSPPRLRILSRKSILEPQGRFRHHSFDCTRHRRWHRNRVFHQFPRELLRAAGAAGTETVIEAVAEAWPPRSSSL